MIDTNLPQQNTGYTYSGNNPTTYNDPTGLKFAIDPPAATKAGGSKGAQPSFSKGQACKSGDWGCRIKEEAKSCGDRSHPRLCDRALSGPISYTYTKRWAITSSASAVEVMNVFKTQPAKIFPFVVKGCSSFTQGSECILHTDQASGTTTANMLTLREQAPMGFEERQVVGYIPNPTNSRGGGRRCRCNSHVSNIHSVESRLLRLSRIHDQVFDL